MNASMAGCSIELVEGMIRNLDLNNPELKASSELLSDFEELVLVFNHAKENELNSAVRFIAESFKNNPDAFASRLVRLNKPRLMNTSELKRLRSAKTSQLITSNTFGLRLEQTWSSVPADFSLYERDFKADDQIRKAEAAKAKFEQIGCKALASCVSEVLMRSCLNDFFLSYRRLSIDYACLILAKLLNCELKDSSLSLRGSPFFVRAYPFADLADSCPPNALKMINDSDLDYPLFDHHLVLIPMASAKEESKVLASEEKTAVVLGERDGLCYFICEWV
jgi:hypothetical protein